MEQITGTEIEDLMKTHLDMCQGQVDDDTLGMLLSLMTSKESLAEEQYNEMVADIFSQAWCMPAMRKRLDHCKMPIQVDDDVLVIIAFLSNGNIGKCITYLYWVMFKCKQIEIEKSLSLKQFVQYMIPENALSDEQLKNFWDNQKKFIESERRTINMIDVGQFAKSLLSWT